MANIYLILKCHNLINCVPRPHMEEVGSITKSSETGLFTEAVSVIIFEKMAKTIFLC